MKNAGIGCGIVAVLVLCRRTHGFFQWYASRWYRPWLFLSVLWLSIASLVLFGLEAESAGGKILDCFFLLYFLPWSVLTLAAAIDSLWQRHFIRGIFFLATVFLLLAATCIPMIDRAPDPFLHREHNGQNLEEVPESEITSENEVSAIVENGMKQE